MSRVEGDSSLANGDVRLFETGNFADATIVCGDRTWKVHKALLSSRCKWFARAFLGNMEEATSGKIVLEEQDPDVIDMMLRFIYAKDINIAKLNSGKDVPALSIKLFRAADFFLINELKEKTKTELRNYLNKMLHDHEDNANDLKSNPAHMLEVKEFLKSIKEAYQDNSTIITREILLKYIWMKHGTLFRLSEVEDLITETPDLGRDLMLKYIRFGVTTILPGMRKPPTGLLILEAFCLPDLIYNASDKNAKPQEGSNAPCLLRHTPAHSSPFKAVHSQTGDQIEELEWLTPSTTQINTLYSTVGSGIVAANLPDGNSSKFLWIRFESSGDAEYYTHCHNQVNHHVTLSNSTASVLQREMQRERGLLTPSAQA